MTIFLTGGSGFLGSHIAELLSEEGFEVRALVRQSSKKDFLRKTGASLVEGDVEDESSIKRWLRGVDAIVHAAGVIKAQGEEEYIKVNKNGTANLLRACKSINPSIQRFIYISSIAAQGPCPSPHPRKKNIPPSPVTIYGRSKLLGEEEVLKFKNLFNVTIIRPPVIFGQRDSEFFKIFKLIKMLRIMPFINKKNLLSIIHAKDVARAVLLSLKKEHPAGSIFPIDDGGVYSWDDLRIHIEKAMGIKSYSIKVSPIFFNAFAYFYEFYGKIVSEPVILNREKVKEMSQLYWICGYEEIKNTLGWEPKFPFPESVGDTFKWYVENGWL